MPHRTFALFTAMLVGCGSSPTQQGSSDTTGAAPGSEGDVSSTGDDIELTHGTVTLELVRGETQASDPFVGTTRVVATLTYQSCLTAFYAAHPELRQDGEQGATIFGNSLFGGEAWIDRLCAGGDAAQASCTVESIVQELGTPPQLTVTYAITGELENHTLRFGPLPTTTTAGCPDPIVRVAAKSALAGEDADGRAIWATDNLADIDAITNQAAAVVIRGARLE